VRLSGWAVILLSHGITRHPAFEWLGQAGRMAEAGREDLLREGSLLVLVVVALPVVKTTMLVSAPFVERFEATGERNGFYLFWTIYLVLEVILLVLVIRARGASSPNPALGATPFARGLGIVLCVTVVALVAARGAGALEVDNTGEVYNLQGADNLLQRLYLVGTVMLAVVCEEMLFRWFAMTALLRRGARRAVAVWLPAMGFGLLHLDLTLAGFVSAVGTAFGGAVLGVVYLRSRTLGWPIVLHAAVIAPIVALAPTQIR
jgi:membrane protease YdiL (CAAX protease family)